MPSDSSPPALGQYSTLGRTGLAVSPLCLGAMTFGEPTGWGTSEEEARRIFDCYRDAGGNFVDTANVYCGGESERLVGEFLSDSASRDNMVVATKFSITTSPGDPNASGNGRKNIYRSLEASLKRLKTDYIDLYLLHFWDGVTPHDEVIDTLDDLVRSGKIRYFGLSDVPAWYMARCQTYAELRGKTRVAAAQLEYSLIDRNIEREHVVAAQELGIGICTWSPLGSGLLTGKYRGGKVIEGDGRLSKDEHFRSRQLTEHNLKIVDTLVEIATELERSPAQVALNWITRRPGIRSTIIGATKLSQIEDNLGALDFVIPEELSKRLDQISHRPAAHLYDFFQNPLRSTLTAANVTTHPGWELHR